LQPRRLSRTFRNPMGDSERQKSLIRAGVALLYAHWEGFVKKVADLYYEFVGYQRCTLAELNDCFVSIALKQEMELLQNTYLLGIICSHPYQFKSSS
jgi:MAE_28990/MAE_18760-like HEPN